jgi:hypothetical protein
MIGNKNNGDWSPFLVSCYLSLRVCVDGKTFVFCSQSGFFSFSSFFSQWKLDCGRLRRGGRLRCWSGLYRERQLMNKKGRLFTRNALERLENKKKGKREGRTGDDEREAGGADGDAKPC